MTHPYEAPDGGLPPQTRILTGRAKFTNSYAVIPKMVHTDIVTTRFPFWEGSRAWVLARPLSGFAETFSQYIVEVMPTGGSDAPEPDPQAEAVLFVLEGGLSLTLEGTYYTLGPGSYVYVAPGADWSLRNITENKANFVWIRKAYEPIGDQPPPHSFVTHEDTITPTPMPDTDGKWSTTRFVNPDDVAHDMHVNIVNFEPGGVIPFAETHVMEHGLYVLEGKAVYRLNTDWLEVEAGDFLWLRAFCPQACYAGGPNRFRYLLYKDMNRHPRLTR
ncbi:MAG: bifunctional allantoicase/(S)-ureidoglycine aminohydrolase [Pseudomonadota bacterium]